ncbi:hypothetical protein E2320_007613 [Naja naja]|nr:hypothetical protein E2320_007613 [Naja naja]
MAAGGLGSPGDGHRKPRELRKWPQDTWGALEMATGSLGISRDGCGRPGTEPAYTKYIAESCFAKLHWHSHTTRQSEARHIPGGGESNPGDIELSQLQAQRFAPHFLLAQPDGWTVRPAYRFSASLSLGAAIRMAFWVGLSAD